MDNTINGELIRQARETKNETQEKVVEKAGIPYYRLQRFEQQQRAPLAIKHLRALAQYFNLSADALLGIVPKDCRYPLRITVASAHPYITVTHKDDGLYINMDHPAQLAHHMERWGPVPGDRDLDDALYTRILAAESHNDIAQLVDDLIIRDTLYFASWGYISGHVSAVSCEKAALINIVNKDIQHLRDVIRVYADINSALKHPDNEELVSQAFRCGETYGMGATYDPDDPDTLDDSTSVYYCSKIGQYIAISDYDIEDYQIMGIDDPERKLTRNDIIECYLEDGPYTTIHDYAQIFVARHIIPHLAGITTDPVTTDGPLSLRCPTILAAMYQRLLLAEDRK